MSRPVPAAARLCLFAVAALAAGCESCTDRLRNVDAGTDPLPIDDEEWIVDGGGCSTGAGNGGWLLFALAMLGIRRRRRAQP